MECRVRGIHQLSCCRQSTRSTDGLAGVSVRRLAAQVDTNVVRILQHGFRVFFGVSQFCGSCRGRRMCSRVGRSAHGVSGLSGVRSGPCEVAFLFSANFLSAVSFQLFFQKKTPRARPPTSERCSKFEHGSPTSKFNVRCSTIELRSRSWDFIVRSSGSDIEF